MAASATMRAQVATMLAITCLRLPASQGTPGTGVPPCCLWREAGPRGELLNGRVVKFKYFPTGSKEAPRFPVFLGWRADGDM
jgi:hypothetical protein